MALGQGLEARTHREGGKHAFSVGLGEGLPGEGGRGPRRKYRTPLPPPRYFVNVSHTFAPAYGLFHRPRRPLDGQTLGGYTRAAGRQRGGGFFRQM